MMTALVLALALAQVPTPGPSAAPPTAPTWQQVVVTPTLVRWRHPLLLAEVRAAKGRFAPVVAQALTARGATSTLEKGRVRLWRAADAAALRASLPPEVAAHLVPVLSVQPTTAARFEVPVGGVVVQLAPGADAQALALAHGWALEADLGGGVWRLSAPPGAPSLALASAAANVPAVRLAQPELWRAGALK